MITAAKLVAGLVLAVGGVGTSVAVMNTADSPERDQGVVERVVDGDTVDVAVGGTTTRIRLLNIDTPESVDPNQPVQCLGPEATEFLRAVLPVGTAVGLQYDEERIDQYDRTLAAVFTPDGKLVNAEVARQGLAAAVVVGDNDRFYPQVEQARDEAMAAGRGLYSPDVACTVPAQVRAVAAATDSVPAVDALASATDLDGTAGAAATAAAKALGLQQAFGDGRLGVAWAALPPTEQERLTGVVAAGHEKAQQAEAAARTAASAAREREAAAARVEEARRQAEARERAAQEEWKRQERARRAEEQAAAKAAKEAAERRKQAEKKAETPKEPDTSASDGGSSGPAGYTGPRCYAPGGKTWRPC